MVRRLKDYRARNPEDDTSTKAYFINTIGSQNVLDVDATLDE
jgi:hypothetical protein